MKLSNWLQKNGIARAAFAREVGVSPASVSRWCDGSRRPERSQFDAISRATGGEVGVSDFFDLACEPRDWRCRVRAWMLQNNIRTRDLARALRVTETTTASWLCGNRRPSVAAAVRIIANTDRGIRIEDIIHEQQGDHDHAARRAARQKQAARVPQARR
jgi:transcriptional regulator with XRE-family HTH domain